MLHPTVSGLLFCLTIMSVCVCLSLHLKHAERWRVCSSPEAKERASKYLRVSECRLSRCLCVCLCFKECNPICFSVLYLCPLGLTWGYKVEVPTARVAAHVTRSNHIDLLLPDICTNLQPMGWGEVWLLWPPLCLCRRVQTCRDWGLFILMKCDKAAVINSKLSELHLMLCFWPHNVWQSSSLCFWSQFDPEGSIFTGLLLNVPWCSTS